MEKMIYQAKPRFFTKEGKDLQKLSTVASEAFVDYTRMPQVRGQRK